MINKRRFANFLPGQRPTAGLIPGDKCQANMNRPVWVLSLTLLLTAAGFTQTYTYSVFANFPATGPSVPHSVIISPQGFLYGTSGGGTYNGGTVFKVTPKGTLSVLYNFGATSTDGTGPWYTLVRDASNNLYGLTQLGGASGWGTIFKVSSKGEETILYDFSKQPVGNVRPSGLSRDSAGNLYGYDDPANEAYYGEVYQLTPSGEFSILYAFCPDITTCPGITGEFPEGAPTLRDGNLYGDTWDGGGVFEITPAGEESIVQNFDVVTDGGEPWFKLTQDSAGNMYGSTSFWGDNDSGAIFKVDSTGAFSVLYELPKGNHTSGPLVVDASGNLFGIASILKRAYIFKLSPEGVRTILYSSSDPTSLGTELVMDKAGNLYGTSPHGGSAGTGAVYKLTKH
jgi:uncharacterized repeat protein (TIGR03803 family)